MSRFRRSLIIYSKDVWLQRQLDSGRRGVYKIDVLAQRLWTEIVLKPHFQKLIQVCLTSININRQSRLSSLDTKSIKFILDLYFDENSIDMMDDDIYMDSFEEKFLDIAEDFYCRKKLPIIESNDELLEYLKTTVQNIDFEINQARAYLPEEKPTLRIFTDLLKKKPFSNNILNVIVGKLQLLVSDENNYQELTALFEPIRELIKLKNELLKLIETHIYEKAMNTIESINDDLINGYAKFINQNPVSKRISITMTLAEILARYCDSSLRKGNKAIKNDEWNEKLDNIMVIFQVPIILK
ncbi:unnamed protein product [Adineta steineri]|uniref:Cullin family profile domain-containing protein n=1 Tax=Adineta steineri TaxID=433720 RepID=A0A813TRB8_9BILA|nr:unnamed protein product [Adineta steineri]